MIAVIILDDPENQSLKETAYKQAHDILLTQKGTSIDKYSDYETNKKNYTQRLTYGFEQTGDTTKPMIVPKGAEVLLETRLPYLDNTGRRYVLYTTGLPSGYEVLDDTEGWGRLNLFAAANGYGSFPTDVSVTMDASKGGFHEFDSWKNDITGTGSLTKKGSGTLALTGKNTYTGGTTIKKGALEADSKNAFGKGDVTNNGGTLTDNTNTSILIGDDFTQSKNSTLELNIGSNKEIFKITDQASFGGTLEINFVNSYVPDKNITVITYDKLIKNKQFSKVKITGLPDSYKAKIVYDKKGLRIVDNSNTKVYK